MKKEPLNEGVLPHTPGTDDGLAIGSQVTTGGRHGAANKMNTGNEGTNSQNGDVQQPKDTGSPRETETGSVIKAETGDQRSYNGNNDADANRTPYAGSKEE